MRGGTGNRRKRCALCSLAVRCLASKRARRRPDKGKGERGGDSHYKAITTIAAGHFGPAAFGLSDFRDRKSTQKCRAGLKLAVLSESVSRPSS